MKSKVYISFFIFLFSLLIANYSLLIAQTPPITAQRDSSTGSIITTQLIDGEVLPYIFLRKCVVSSRRMFKNTSEEAEYYRLVRSVKKAYPYAIICQQKINYYNEQMKAAKSNHERRVLLRKAEKEIKDTFTEDIKDMTYSQGRVLIKLVYRQTGSSSYELIKEYRGFFRAFFWQSIGLLFGNDLKVKYDPDGADKNIEQIVQLIDEGLL